MNLHANSYVIFFSLSLLDAPDSGPYYSHLGVASSLPELRSIMEKRTGVEGSGLRIEKVKHCPKEGKGTNGCPIAKYVSLTLHWCLPQSGHVRECALF